MNAHKKLLSLTKLCLLACTVTFQAAANNPCRFNVPECWEPTRTRWDGECVGGVAHGLGVLKELGGKDGDRFFFGRMKKGSIEFGAIDLSGGYIVGKFENGRLLDTDDENRQDTVYQAFKVAAKAARQVADRYRKAGNKASADFYLAKAKKLALQLEAE